MQNAFSQIEFLTNATSLIQNQIKHNTYTQYTYIRHVISVIEDTP